MNKIQEIAQLEIEEMKTVEGVIDDFFEDYSVYLDWSDISTSGEKIDGAFIIENCGDRYEIEFDIYYTYDIRVKVGFDFDLYVKDTDGEEKLAENIRLVLNDKSVILSEE